MRRPDRKLRDTFNDLALAYARACRILLPSVIGGMSFFDGDKDAATGIAHLSICDQLGFDRDTVFG